MNIVLVAPKSDFTEQVHKAFERVGCQVQYVDDRVDYSLPRVMRPWRWFWRLSRRVSLLRQRSNHALQCHIIEIALRNKSSILFSTKGMNIKPQTFASLRRMGVVTAVWFPDNATNEPYASWVRKIGPLWDHFFSFDSAIKEQMPMDAVHRVHILPFGVDPSIYDVSDISLDDHACYDSDVCFVGAPYPDRVHLLQQITDRNVKIWGWSGWKDTPLRDRYHGPLDAQQSAKAYRCAKISMNTNILPRAKGVNLKTFEIAASGGFQLTDHPADLDSSFVPGIELDVFEDESQFRSKVDHWLSHDQERQAIAAAGRIRALSDHTLDKRIRTILDTIIV